MKKGFSLIELLASLVIISITMIFITSFIVNIRKEKIEMFYDTDIKAVCASISKILNEDALKYGISSIIQTNPSNDNNFIINYKNGKVGKLKVFYSDNKKSLRYTVDDEVVFLKTFKGPSSITSSYSKNNQKYYKEYDIDNDGTNDHVFFKYIISVPESIEVYYYGPLSISS